MKRLVIAGALALTAAGQALAADLPQPLPPPRAPVVYMPVAPVYNWGGIYYGINGGYGFGKTNWTDPNNFSGLNSTQNFGMSGFLVGGTVGANFQSNAFVFGVETDLDYSTLDGKSSNLFCSSVGFGAAQCETKNTWLWHGARALRLCGGPRAVLRHWRRRSWQCRSRLQWRNFDTSTKIGWTAGAGVEAAFADNWTARIEYLYRRAAKRQLQHVE